MGGWCSLRTVRPSEPSRSGAPSNLANGWTRSRDGVVSKTPRRPETTAEKSLAPFPQPNAKTGAPAPARPRPGGEKHQSVRASRAGPEVQPAPPPASQLSVSRRRRRGGAARAAPPAGAKKWIESWVRAAPTRAGAGDAEPARGDREWGRSSKRARAWRARGARSRRGRASHMFRMGRVRPPSHRRGR